MDKILLKPAGNDTDYESNICDLEEKIFDSVNNGSVAFDDEAQAYTFRLKDLNFDFPEDEDDIKKVCTDIQDELDFRLKSYNDALRAHAANNDEGDADGEDYSYTPASVWLKDGVLYAKF